MTIEDVARVCHAANKAYSERLGDTDQPSWEDASEEERQSYVAGVKFLREDPYRQPEDMHLSWMQRKFADGWKLGPVKDEVAKEHPRLAPYPSLSPEQRMKDMLFSSIVRATSPLVVEEPAQPGV